MVFRPLGKLTCLKVNSSSSFRSSATGEYEIFFNLILAGETELEDSITLKVGNPGITTLTNDQARQMLQKADFEGHGFQKEELRSLLSAGKFSANCEGHYNGVGSREMFICSKLGQNLSEIEVRTFVRIQRLTWHHLLASKVEIIQKQGSF